MLIRDQHERRIRPRPEHEPVLLLLDALGRTEPFDVDARVAADRDESPVRVRLDDADAQVLLAVVRDTRSPSRCGAPSDSIASG